MTVFYRKYRPQKLSELVGQDSVKETLLSQLKSGRISHGYLFSGPKGTGKTSTARIFAKAVNCEAYRSKIGYGEPCNRCSSCQAIVSGAHLDLIEIDAASNRLISDVRDLIEKIKLLPVSGKFKVYILDEAHMLTPESFNALLKTLEEPPAHVIFIFCTTEPSKLPGTILSRLSRFNFSPATEGEIPILLSRLAKDEGIKVQKEALLAITRAADGSFRDAVSILDQLSTKKEIAAADVANLAKITGFNQVYVFIQNLIENNLKESVSQLESLAKTTDLSLFGRDLLLLSEKLLLLKIGVEVSVGGEELKKLKILVDSIEFGGLEKLIKLFLIAEGEIKHYPLPQIPLILAACKFCNFESKVNEIVEVERIFEEPKASKKNNLKKEPAVVARIKNPKNLKSLVAIDEKWQDFLAVVKPLNAHVFALLKSTRPAAFDGVNLELEVFYRFHKDKLEEPKIIRVLDQSLSKVMGGDIRLKFVLAKKESKPPKAVRASDVIEAHGGELDQLEKMTQEIFQK